MRKRARFKATVETMEDRLAPGTLTLVNDTNSSVYLQIVRHYPPTSGQLADGTSWQAPTPGYTQWSGSYQVKSGTALDFYPGDGNPSIRVSPGGGRYYTLSGSGIASNGSRYATLSAGYNLQRSDGSSNYSVTIGNHNYGSRLSSALASLGVNLVSGFYSVPNDETITINGPRKITGTESFSFADYSGNLSSTSVFHTFSPPHGSTITSYTTSIISARGDNVQFYNHGTSLVESGTVSGGGLFSYGGSYVGSVQVNYAYP